MRRIDIIVLILVVLLGGATYALYGMWQKEKELRKETETLYKSQDEIKTTYYQNKFGQEVAKREAIELSNATLRRNFESKELEWLKQFKSVDNKISRLEAGIQSQATVIKTLTAKLEDFDTVIIRGKDTIRLNGKSFVYQDKYTTAKGIISGDSIIQKIEMQVPLDIAIYHKKKWLFGRKKYFTEATSKNPDAKIEITSTLIKKRK